jgi:hypothetical protein
MTTLPGDSYILSSDYLVIISQMINLYSLQ